MEMDNLGEKRLKVMTKEGRQCELKMQVTDVRKPLMSVARVCDAGHTVVFRRDGGEIVDNETGKATKFSRVNNVYRLEVELPSAKVYPTVFRRQGM